jgi:hypothetical protein
MSCMCLRKLKTFLESLKNLPLNMLASLIPKDLPLIVDAWWDGQGWRRSSS